MTIGQQIRHIRVDRNIRQGVMAKKLHISQNFLSLIENDKKTPSVALLQRLVKFYKVDIEIGRVASYVNQGRVFGKECSLKS